ncbi:hypothetical protein HYV79_02725 [Candidatus Woesearchaeota archaeon]|nr:hypothetical protein [Candidatus Woesearchaeota archaeon]
MASKFKELFTNWKIIILIISLIVSLLVIKPSFNVEGVAISAVISNSAASEAGFAIESKLPTKLERILKIDDKEISSVQDYFEVVKTFSLNQSIQLKTNKKLYRLTVKPKFVEKEVVGIEDIGLKIIEAPTSNIRKGLDLAGGTRIILKPQEELTQEQIKYIIDNLKERLNVYGLADLAISEVATLGEERLILVEIAGASEDEIHDLLAKQGKFEAVIANKTAFVGGSDSVNYVCRDRAECSGIDPNRGCQKVENNYVCGFFFHIILSPNAAQQQADITKNIPLVTKNSGRYLSEQIVFYLDSKEVDRLDISESLKGRAETTIVISGSGTGSTYNEAKENALNDMKKLQTVLQTGSLPTKLEIVKSDSISPILGKSFIKNAFIMGFVAMIAVTIIVSFVYKKLEIIVPLFIIQSIEILLILGFAAFIGWNMDLASIAGIIASVGTGVDDLIVFTDEILRKEKETEKYMRSWKQSIKRAFFIIMAAYFTTFAAMVPLWYFGAGLLKGFAITTIAGITIGVLITRPAYAEILKYLTEEK